MEDDFKRTKELLECFEGLYKKKFDNMTEEEKRLTSNPMLHLAEALFMDFDSSLGWDHSDLEDLAKYLCVICDIKEVGVHVTVV